MNQCGSSHDRCARIGVRVLGRVDIESGWCQVAKHIPGVENRLADGILRWPEEEIQNSVNHLRQEQGWR